MGVSNLDLIRRQAIGPALSLLPGQMSSPEAVAMLLAIGLQESRFIHRRQVNGPARGYWQFELPGVAGVLRHDSSREPAREVLISLNYGSDDEGEIWKAIEHNDILAAAIARLLLWTHPRALPSERNPGGAWDYYLACWRPGKPHRKTWDAFYQTAWEAV